MLRLKFSKGNTVVSLIISFLIIVIALMLAYNRQYVIDQFTVWNYKPTTEVTALVDRAGMSGDGKFIYYASQPKLDGTSDFNTECDRVENITSILGCYSNDRIYIYNITDQQLDGIREVTAAHETLHAVYQRMSDSDKQKVDALIEVEYKKLATDKSFQARMTYYAKSEPGQRDNELHSMIGTEVANISPELEAHYKKYFNDRQKVVALNAKYSGVFKALDDKRNELTTELNALSADINKRTAQYNSDVNALNNDIAAFNNKANSGLFLSQYQFNKERSALTSRVLDLEKVRDGINADVNKYNAILIEYNSIALQTKKLNSSIDSTFAPAPSI